MLLDDRAFRVRAVEADSRKWSCCWRIPEQAMPFILKDRNASFNILCTIKNHFFVSDNSSLANYVNLFDL
jgi:hypothetical protein